MHFKRSAALTLAILMLFSNIGLAVNVHFCEGKIASVSSAFSVEEVCETLVPESVSDCCAAKAQSHKSCCQDKLVSIKKHSDNTISKVAGNEYPAISIDYSPVEFFRAVSFRATSSQVRYFCDAHAPPLYKLYSSYIFYA